MGKKRKYRDTLIDVRRLLRCEFEDTKSQTLLHCIGLIDSILAKKVSSPQGLAYLLDTNHNTSIRTEFGVDVDVAYTNASKVTAITDAVPESIAEAIDNYWAHLDKELDDRESNRNDWKFTDDMYDAPTGIHDKDYAEYIRG